MEIDFFFSEFDRVLNELDAVIQSCLPSQAAALAESKALLNDIQRSVLLSEDYDREHDDLENAEIRIVILESMISVMMNQSIALYEQEKARTAELLDAANEAAWRSGNEAQTYAEKEKFTSPPEKAIYLTNYAYELLQRLNTVVQFKTDFRNPPSHIIRTLNLSKIERPGGLTILSALARLLQEEFVEDGVKVALSDKGGRFVFSVEFPPHLREAVEQKLGAFGDAIRHGGSLSTVVSDPSLLMHLEQQIEFGKLQLKYEQRTHNLTLGRLEQLENMMEKLSSALTPLAVTAQQSSLALAGLADRSVESLIKFVRESEHREERVDVRDALITVSKAIEDRDIDSDELQKAVEIIRQNKPSVLKNIRDKAQDAVIAGVSGEGVKALLAIISGAVF